MKENHYTPKETAQDWLKVKDQTLRVWRMKGIGPSYVRISKNRVLYPESAIRAFLEARTFSSTSEETVKAGSRAATNSAEPAPASIP